jgi:hypothetical protein
MGVFATLPLPSQAKNNRGPQRKYHAEVGSGAADPPTVGIVVGH